MCVHIRGTLLGVLEGRTWIAILRVMAELRHTFAGSAEIDTSGMLDEMPGVPLQDYLDR